MSAGLRILCADSNNERRSFYATYLAGKGFDVMQAIDGGTSIKVIEEWKPHLAVFHDAMTPADGFEMVDHIRLNGHRTGLIMLTENPTTDLLQIAARKEIQQVLHLPVEPDRLLKAVKRVLRTLGFNLDIISVQDRPVFTKEELMRRTIALARQNALSRMGGPYAALVADKEGHILGEGVNNVTSRVDPTAHAEVMAVRAATQTRGDVRLEDCVIYCSSEPTMLGQALIISTGISRVFYGLTHEEVGAQRANEEGIIGEISKPIERRAVPYDRMLSDEAKTMIAEWQRQKQKVSD